jgi:hypothetical protein
MIYFCFILIDGLWRMWFKRRKILYRVVFIVIEYDAYPCAGRRRSGLRYHSKNSDFDYRSHKCCCVPQCANRYVISILCIQVFKYYDRVQFVRFMWWSFHVIRTSKKRGISLHIFPKDRRLRQEWKIKLQIGKAIPCDARVCSIHFTNADFKGKLTVQYSVLNCKNYVNSPLSLLWPVVNYYSS